LLNDLHGKCKTLKAQGILPLMQGFESTPVLDLAAYSDIAFASGDGLWPCQMAPSSVSPIEKSLPNVGGLS
jgi:hypothetical protein